MAVERIPRGKFTKEFREEAVRMIIEEKISIPEVGRRLQLPPSTIRYWVKAYEAGKLGEVGKGQRGFGDRQIVEVESGMPAKFLKSASFLPILAAPVLLEPWANCTQSIWRIFMMCLLVEIIAFAFQRGNVAQKFPIFQNQKIQGLLAAKRLW